MSFETQHPECTFSGSEKAAPFLASDELPHTIEFFIVENIPDGLVNNKHRFWVCSAHIEKYEKYPDLYKVER
jgi:hypothetical protein